MIVPELKVLFVHIPKVAGQSVENYLLQSIKKERESDGAHYLLKPNTNAALGPPRLAHLCVNDYKRFAYISEKDFDEYFKFSFVRNPFDRVISFYKFYGFNSLISFSLFATKYLPYYFETEHWFFKPQTDFIYNENNVLQVDYLGRFENLDSNFEEILNQINLPIGTLQKSNVSQRKSLISRKSFQVVLKHPEIIQHISFTNKANKDYRILYTPAAKKIVTNLYERDLRLLDYSF